MARRPKLISEQVRDAIRSATHSPSALAEKAGFSRSLMSRFMNGEADLSLRNLDALGKLLGLELRQKGTHDGQRD